MARLLLIGVAVFGLAVSATAAEPAQGGAWGSIKSRIVFQGELNAAQVKKFRDDVTVYEPRTMQQSLLGVKPKVAATVPNQSLLVDPATHGLKNAFVYLKQKPNSIHPQALEHHGKSLEVDFRDHRFSPRDLIVMVGQTVRVKADKEGCNVKMDLFKNRSVNALVKPEEALDWQPTAAEPLPVRVGSAIQPAAASFWLVIDHPYAALTAADGSFQLDNLPAGEHELFVWHESVGYVAKKLKVAVQAGNVTELAPLPLTADRLK